MNGNDKLISCYDPEFNSFNSFIKRNCELKCKVDCNFKHYQLEIDRKNLVDSISNLWVSHSEHPDIFIKHIPEINLINF